jgi:prevent-host-death family protein
MRVGLREANQRFSKLIKTVRRGHEVVLTDRGKPVAKITPVAESTESALDQMAAMGLVRRATSHGPMPPFKPRKLRGKSIAQTLREDRDAD